MATQEDQTQTDTDSLNTSSSKDIQSEDLLEYKNKYTKLLAEVINLSKQKDKEIESITKYANNNLLLKVIDLLDDISAALKQNNTNNEDFKQILTILEIKIMQILTLEGVQEKEINLYDLPDPLYCEVIQAIPTNENEKNGCIIEIVKKCYTIHDRVLRSAKVIVAKNE